MGQPNAKDVKRKSYSAAYSGRPAVRPSVYTDAVLVSATAPTATLATTRSSSSSSSRVVHHHNNNNNSTSGNSRNNSVMGSSLTGGVGANYATAQHTRHVDPARASSARGGSAAAAAAGAGNSNNNNVHTYPIVLRYVGRYVQLCLDKRKPVSVLVEALNWQPLAMTPSTDSFYALLELPAGQHNYRFLIDGSEVVDDAQPLAPTQNDGSSGSSGGTLRHAPPHSSGGEGAGAGVSATAPLPPPVPPRDGKLANMVYLNEVLLTTREDDDMMDDGEGWGQEVIMFEESRKYPPVMPVHLRYTPLNTPSTLLHNSSHHSPHHHHSGHQHSPQHGAADGGNDGYADVSLPPEHLPLPLSVTINHVYFQRRDDHAVMGVTTRYCNKFTTVVYYTHMPSASSAGDRRNSNSNSNSGSGMTAAAASTTGAAAGGTSVAADRTSASA